MLPGTCNATEVSALVRLFVAPNCVLLLRDPDVCMLAGQRVDTNRMTAQHTDSYPTPADEITTLIITAPSPPPVILETTVILL
jgi:hypothetical protein